MHAAPAVRCDCPPSSTGRRDPSCELHQSERRRGRTHRAQVQPRRRHGYRMPSQQERLSRIDRSRVRLAARGPQRAFASPRGTSTSSHPRGIDCLPAHPICFSSHRRPRRCDGTADVHRPAGESSHRQHRHPGHAECRSAAHRRAAGRRTGTSRECNHHMCGKQTQRNTFLLSSV